MTKLSALKVATVAVAMSGLGMLGLGAAGAAPTFGPIDYYDTATENSEGTFIAMDDDWEDMWGEGWDD